MSVRTRFAPSPTGELHLGGARTALFNWLFAKSQKGKFLLRIEDTDAKRSNDQTTKNIIRDLKWLQLHWDEDIVYQKENIDKHQEVISKLLASGHAYHCYCNEEEINDLNNSLEIVNKNIKSSQKEEEILQVISDSCNSPPARAKARGIKRKTKRRSRSKTKSKKSRSYRRRR